MRLADRMGRLGTESAFEVLAKARALEAAGVDVVHLEIGEPDAATPSHIVAAGQEGLASGLTHYVPAPGTPELRAAVAAFLERTGRLRTSPDRVLPPGRGADLQPQRLRGRPGVRGQPLSITRARAGAQSARAWLWRTRSTMLSRARGENGLVK